MCVCVCVLLRDQTRHSTRPTTTAPASPVSGFINFKTGVGSCIPSYGPGVCGWLTVAGLQYGGHGGHAILSSRTRGRKSVSVHGNSPIVAVDPASAAITKQSPLCSPRSGRRRRTPIRFKALCPSMCRTAACPVTTSRVIGGALPSCFSTFGTRV